MNQHQHQHQHQHLPPSPPPSPPRRRHNKQKKKNTDPLQDLSTPLPSPELPSSPNNEAGESPESLITRIILTPLYMTSFLISLFLINRSNRQKRLDNTTHHHSSSSSSSSPSSPNSTTTTTTATTTPTTSTTATALLRYLTPTAWIAHPEPYQSPADTTWDRRPSSFSSHVAPNDTVPPRHQEHVHAQDSSNKRKEKHEKTNSWHLHKKIRKVARLEITDAFEMHGRVMVLLVGVLGAALVAAWCVGWWVVGWVWR